ncbi:energy transducer TonB [Ochrovirga pacifica]|uniref:energy transducer TonB n=1 Tax=Ochrovirga pacifica TaxID=1042376 RepID=UPI00025591F0|nr:energy transducer TonB [Ochrovirga pacifica]
MEVKKNPKSNLENFSKVFTLLGLVLALYIVYIAIEHKTYDRVVDELQAVTLQSEEVEDMVMMQIKPPSTPPPPPPPPPPPSPEQFEKVEDDVEVEEVVIQSTEIELDDKIEVETIEYSEEVEEVVYEDIPFAAIQNPAIFPGCEKAKDKKACFSEKVNKHISKNFDTGLADELGLSGIIRMAAIFKIDTNGKVTEVRVRSKNPELSKEFESAINKLPQMVPASQNGRKVNLLFSLPLVFRVE